MYCSWSHKATKDVFIGAGSPLFQDDILFRYPQEFCLFGHDVSRCYVPFYGAAGHQKPWSQAFLVELYAGRHPLALLTREDNNHICRL